MNRSDETRAWKSTTYELYGYNGITARVKTRPPWWQSMDGLLKDFMWQILDDGSVTCIDDRELWGDCDDLTTAMAQAEHALFAYLDRSMKKERDDG